MPSNCSSQLSGEGESPSNAENEEVGGQPGGLKATQPVRELSETLTNRLCALVGLELAEGEVARWSSTYGDEDDPLWGLLTRSGEATFCPLWGGADHRVPGLAGVRDPLDALRAAVAAMEAR